MDTDRDLLFGVLAMQAGLLDADRFSEACAIRSGRADLPLAGLLVEKGWITPADKDEIERRLLGKLAETTYDTRDTEVATGDREPEGSSDGLQGTEVATADGRGPEGPSLTIAWESRSLEATERLSAGDKSAEASSGSAPTEPMETVDALLDPSDEGHELLARIARDHDARERYSLTRLHAKGGIGQVWLARDADLGREVALKQLRPDCDANPIVWTRFLEEARITGQLEHPGIIPVYELALRDDGRPPFYTMRFVRGRTLSEAIAAYHGRRKAGEAGPLDLRELLGALVAICNAVAYAHSRGVIHRDLKGRNVMLGDFGEVMVLDWGLAKLIGRDGRAAQVPPVELDPGLPHGATVQGHVLGTPAYMSPEQAEGRNEGLDGRTDVYSLGAVFYEILTGQPPFTGSTNTEVLRKVVKEPPSRPRLINAEAPAALEAICLRALAKKPEDRYATASDLAAEIRRWMADEPVDAFPEPWTKRAARWARRHQTVVASAVALLITSVAALSVGTLLISRARDEARLQRQQARQAVDDMYTDVAQKWLEDRIDPLQREFLGKALAYYERFAGQDSSEPRVRQERGQAYQRMGDILRKLGRHDEAERAYRRAVEILGELAADYPAQREHRYHRAYSQNRLGVALAARGAFSEAEPIYRLAIDAEEALVAGSAEPPYRIDLAKAYKNLADLLRVNGRHVEAEKAYRRAIDLEEKLLAAPPGEAEVRQDLSAASDYLGLLLKQLGRLPEARAAFFRSLELQEGLATEFPTLPRYREGLSKVLSSVGLFLRENGTVQEAEPVLRRALEVDEKLAADFPLRPEYRRDLARSHINLGLLLQSTNRLAEAEKVHRRASEIYEALTVDYPTVLQYRQDLARNDNDLGSLLKSIGQPAEAEKFYRRAIRTYEALAAENPTVPDYRQGRALSLINLGGLQAALGRAAEAEESDRRALEIYESLVAEFPDKVKYRSDLAKGLNNLGGLMRTTGRRADAEAAYRRAVELYETLAAASPGAPEYRLAQARTLSNLGGLRLAGAGADYAKALELCDRLVADFPGVPGHQQMQAIALNNLGEFRESEGRLAEAEQSYVRARERLEPLVAESPDLPDYRSNLGYVFGNLGSLRLVQEKPAEALPLLEKAVEHERIALKANPRSAGVRQALRDHGTKQILALFALGEHAEAARVAADLVPIARDRAEGRYDAACILARCIPLADRDAKLPEEAREALARSYGDRAMALLREAIEGGFNRVDGLIGNADLEPLKSREDFKGLVAELGGSAKPKPD